MALNSIKIWSFDSACL